MYMNSHLVAEPNGSKQKQTSSEKVKYQYNEHYFLTDPDEFIYEFIADDPQWQLLAQPISLNQFVRLPVIRSVFFSYGLEFTDNVLEAILMTNERGGIEIKIAVPIEFQDELVFQYKLSFADEERKSLGQYNGANLERFVFQTFTNGAVSFSIHVPAIGKYFFEVFANSFAEFNRSSIYVDESKEPAANPQFRLRSACKFRIECGALIGKMHPLPECAQGEWGPMKAQRNFRIFSPTHSDGMITTNDGVTIQLEYPKSSFMFFCKLRANDLDDNDLKNFVAWEVQDGVLTVTVIGPRTGQYGLDVYTKVNQYQDAWKHVCKYLLNFSAQFDRLSEQNRQSIEPSSMGSQLTVQNGPLVLGPTIHFNDFSLKCLSHRESSITADKNGTVSIELSYKSPITLYYQLTDDQLQDYSPTVKVTENVKKSRLLCTAKLPQAGTYILSLNAQWKQIADKKIDSLPIYNFLIQYRL